MSANEHQDDELSDDGLPPLVSDEDEEMPELEESSDDNLPELCDTEEDEDDQWEDITDSDEDEEETTSDDSDIDFPLFSNEATRGGFNNRRSTTNNNSYGFIRSALYPSSEDEAEEDEEDEEDEDEDITNPRRSRPDTQGVLHTSSRSGTHHRYWAEISSSEKSKLDSVYVNTQNAFKFTTSSPHTSSSSSNSIMAENEICHNIDEFLSNLIELITSHTLQAMEVSSQLEISRTNRKPQIVSRHSLLLIFILAIQIKYLKNL